MYMYVYEGMDVVAEGSIQMNTTVSKTAGPLFF